MTTPTETAPDRYAFWQNAPLSIAGSRVLVATKPGVFAHGTVDPASMMLAEQMASMGRSTSVHLNCGNGMVPAAAAVAGGASVLWCSDRSLPSVQATERTMAANGIAGSHVVHAHGTHAFPLALAADVVTIRVSADKLALQQLIWEAFHALRIGGKCYIAGANDEGVKPAVRLLESIFGMARLEAQHSGHRLAVATKAQIAPASLTEGTSPYLDPEHFREVAVTLKGVVHSLYSRPGVFSWEHLDEATQLLGDLMDMRAGESVLDLGCGAGALGLTAASLSGTGRVLMVDADAEAVRCAARGIAKAELANAEVRASDVGGGLGEELFDVVVFNPPFHQGKATDLIVPRQFIADAYKHLKVGGRMMLVANRTLPYEQAIADRFGEVRTIHDGRRFKVLGATR
ncbi:methyltransferase [Gemmatimonas sp.]|uniref:methyltransferase n=1 Tax=Gemmatimonas sp. TaxID=1962908 RepID=UPI00286B9DFB|nr:methyltransferase [Gemmatimonas sp.]